MAEGEEPGDYIINRQDLHDCFFLVGSGRKERISTVKYFLANYSSYFRAMLLETDMKEKKSKEDIVIPDHEPDVFKLMLSYVYGSHDLKFKDVNQAMRFHVLVDKCLMPKLKQISTKYLLQNCKSNLCEVLECSVLLEIKEMEPRAKKIVENDTNALLSSPDFLNANSAIVEFIVRQEGLNVTEVVLWRALVKWAKRHCGNKKDGTVLRKKIANIIQHVQFLKMTLKEFAEDVVPTSILTPAETITIFVDMARGKGNGSTLKEAPSRTRKEWVSPSTCVLSFSDINLDLVVRDATMWECDYEIQNLTTTGLKISSIKLVDLPHMHQLIIHWGNSIKLHIKLLEEPVQQNNQSPYAYHQPRSSQRVVTSACFSLVPGNGLIKFLLPETLSDEWFIKAQGSYKLKLRIPDGNWRQPLVSSYNNPNNILQSDLCKVNFISSTFSNSSYGTPRVGSIVKSFIFSLVPSGTVA